MQDNDVDLQLGGHRIPDVVGTPLRKLRGKMHKLAVVGLAGLLSIATLAPQAQAAPTAPATPPLTVTVVRSDNLGDVHVGDRLTFTITYTNNTQSAVTVFPGDTNLQGVSFVKEGTSSCRYRSLGPGQTGTCNFGYYVASSTDVAQGIQIVSKWIASNDILGQQPVSGGESISATVPAKFEVDPTPRGVVPDAATTPQDRAMGQAVELARASFMNFTCHRIPALTEAPNGDLLAAWDGRPNNCGDAPQENSILQRRSTDGGKSWSMPTVIAAGQGGAQKYGYSDPSYVVDREKGKIFAFFVKSYNQGFVGSIAGTDTTDRNVLQAAMIESSDNGLTWSEPKLITKDVVSAHNDRSRFAASGEGIQIRNGKYKGRLVQQYTVNIGANHSSGTMKAMSVYSDDHGVTWKHGEPVGTGMDENKVVELGDGRLMLNSRSSDNNRARKVAYSSDGGETWSTPVVDPELIDPRNNASIIRAFPNADESDPKSKVLLFSNAFNASGRSNGMVHVSLDSGDTWPIGKVFQAGAMQYSTLTPLSEEGTYGLLYEGTSSTINFMKIDLEWLGLNADGTKNKCQVSAVDNSVPTGCFRVDITGGQAVSGVNSDGYGYAGDPVVVTATVPENHLFDVWEGGDNLGLTEQDGNWAFTMPSAAVSLVAKFKEVPKDPVDPEVPGDDVPGDNSGPKVLPPTKPIKLPSTGC